MVDCTFLIIALIEEEIEWEIQKKIVNILFQNNLGAKSRGFGGNKGKQMQDTSGKHPQVIQTKGE